MNEFNIYLNDQSEQVKVIDEDKIEINQKKFDYQLIELSNKKYLLKLNNKVFEIFHLNGSEQENIIMVNGKTLNLTIRTSLEEKAYKLISKSESDGNHKTIIKSPMPGLVLKIFKTPGETIKKGETVLILEAMKMENEIKAPIDGILFEVIAEQGKPIEKNKILFSIK